MLPILNRLIKKKDFEIVFKKGRGHNGDFLFLKILKNNLSYSRFGFVVSQKISKKATIRNKIKRRLREIIKLKKLEIKKGFDVILVAKPKISQIDFKTLKDELDKLFQKASLI